VTELRWGILSTARINRRLIEAVRASGRSRVVAVASRDRGRAARYAGEWGIAASYGSYEELLRDPDVDVVYNPLPNHLHVPWSVLALEAGKHVLCEKPLALSPEEVDTLIAVAERTGLALAEGFMYRHQPRTRRVRELIRRGAIGPLRLVDGSFTFHFDRPGNFRHDPEAGGGAMWDVGCYPVSFTRYVVAEEAESVAAFAVWEESGIDRTMAGLMRFPSGVVATFRCGFDAVFRSEMTFQGTGGTIHVPRAFQAARRSEIHISAGGEQRTEVVEGFEPSFLGEVQDMERVVLDGAVQEVSWSESRGNAVTLKALLDSSQRR
jgi:D-xylose 1-dehydrogenase (NADP+, D-xylono-1,5-lactone-forming)